MEVRFFFVRLEIGAFALDADLSALLSGCVPGMDCLGSLPQRVSGKDNAGEIVLGRAVGAIAQLLGTSGVFVVSLYGTVSEGLSEANCELLAAVGAASKFVGPPLPHRRRLELCAGHLSADEFYGLYKHQSALYPFSHL